MKRIEDILSSCIEDIRAGKATVEECLVRYPERRQELEPLLKMASSIKSPPAYRLESGYKQSARADLLRQIRPVRQPKKVSFADIISLGLPRQLAGVRAAAATLVIVLVVGALGGGTAFASQSSVPGDVLYPVKTGTENVRLLAAGSPVAKAELNIEFAAKRLKELGRVIEKDEDSAGAVVERYRRHLEAAIQQLEKSGISPDLAITLEDTITEIQKQLDTCDDLIDTAPANSATVYEAADQATTSQVKTLQMMARCNMLKAAELNTGMMQNRLQRATAAATAGRYQIMVQRLSQYQMLNQLGQQILEQAQNTNDQAELIKSISMQQLMVDTETMANLSQQVPAEYQNTIHECEQMIHQFQQRFRYGQDGSGNQGSGPGGYKDETMPGTGSPTATITPATTDNPDTGTATPTTTPGSGSGDNGGSGNQEGPGNGGEAGSGNTDNGTSGKP